MDTTNKQLVSTNGEQILVIMPAQRMSKADALLHAAWLVALADDDDTFADVLEAVQNT